MKILKVPVKFTAEDTVFTTKQTNLEIECEICEGKGTIDFNSKNMRCPECQGKGKFTSNKKHYAVCDEPFIISTTKINISSNGKVNVRYKGRCGHSNYSRGTENLFFTKEEAQLKCDELNKTKILTNLEDIIIPEEFNGTTPSVNKIQERLSYYKENNKFEKYIVVNREMVLQDGYITYLLCKLLNIDYTNVIVEG